MRYRSRLSSHRLKAWDRDTQGGVVDLGLGHKAKAILSRLAIVLTRGHLGEVLAAVGLRMHTIA